MAKFHDGTLSSTEVAALVRVTYRQLSHWLAAGFVVIADQSPGSGAVRRWSPVEVDQVRVVAALVHAGVAPQAAAEAMRTAIVGDGRFLANLGPLYVHGELT